MKRRSFLKGALASVCLSLSTFFDPGLPRVLFTHPTRNPWVWMSTVVKRPKVVGGFEYETRWVKYDAVENRAITDAVSDAEMMAEMGWSEGPTLQIPDETMQRLMDNGSRPVFLAPQT